MPSLAKIGLLLSTTAITARASGGSDPLPQHGAQQGYFHSSFYADHLAVYTCLRDDGKLIPQSDGCGLFTTEVASVDAQYNTKLNITNSRGEKLFISNDNVISCSGSPPASWGSWSFNPMTSSYCKISVNV